MKPKKIDCHELNGRMFVEAKPVSELLREQARLLAAAAADLERRPLGEKPTAPVAKVATGERKPRASAKKLSELCSRIVDDKGCPMRTDEVVETLRAAGTVASQKAVDRALSSAAYVCTVDGWRNPRPLQK